MNFVRPHNTSTHKTNGSLYKFLLPFKYGILMNSVFYLNK